MSLRGRTIFSERGVPDADLEDHIVKWPGRVPKAAKKMSAKKRRVGKAWNRGDG